MKPDFDIPIETNVRRDVDRLAADELQLHYLLVDASGRQTVTKGRLLALPMIDLNQYRCRAVFDWIEFKVTLGRELYAVHVGNSLNGAINEPKLGKAYVYGPNLERHHSGNTFRIRMFDPSSRRMNAALQHLRWKYGSRTASLRLGHKITGVEISIDFYPIPTHAETDDGMLLLRAQASELLRKHFRLDPSFRTRGDFDHFDEMPRYRDDVGTKKMVSAPPGLIPENLKEFPKALLGADRVKMHRKPPLDSTVYVGAKTVKSVQRPILFRLQDKVADQRGVGDDNFIALELRDRRSRIEICLLDVPDYDTMKDFGIQTMDDLTNKDWGKLRKKFFNFQFPTLAMEDDGTANGDELEIFKRTGVIGLDLHHRSVIEKTRANWDRQNGHRPRKMRENGHCRAFSELNQKITRAMEKLGASL
ncbi:hypothetical protein LR948_13640 [Roseivivax sp. GX 12232]|uniref:hypothetical protein n=1 Tax=Roseivivax sp. GX 12232 TaxID=2900547 RepID=UPI001E485FFE|nr:hypothetical protein [Roseivivax sp. GX 12232]MCE0506408.1 hypothetical protein [Roseivivax sp. GX 12232]